MILNIKMQMILVCVSERVNEAPTYRIESHTHCTTLVRSRILHYYGATDTIYKATESKQFKHVRINLKNCCI